MLKDQVISWSGKKSAELGFLFFAVVAAFFIFLPGPARAATEVGGVLFNQIWTLAGSPYIVDTNNPAYGVGIDGSLTIEPGVIVKLKAGAQILAINGKLIANGTPGEPIIFTAYTDDSVGGDTNGDATSTLPVKGYWSRVELSSNEDNIEYAEFHYGAKCVNSTVGGTVIKNSRFENCLTGLDASGATSAIVIQNNTFTGNDRGIFFLAPLGVIAGHNNIYGNLEYGMENPHLRAYQPEYMVDARENWWGHASGPYNPTINPTGQGDNITDNFLIDGFLSAPVQTPSTTPTSTPSGPDPFAGASSGQILPVSTPPNIIKFLASPTSFKEGEDGTTLEWETQGAGYVTLFPGGQQPLSGTLHVVPEETTSYELVALGPGGEVRQELVVEVLPRDPVIIVPGILGSSRGWDDELVLDPILHTYDGLWEGLKSVGYEPGKTLFAFPYDWRNDNRDTASLFDQKVKDILAICHCLKVDVVAHSMGGLAVRYYIQNINDSTIDQLIFLGTPHLGAPKAYLAWEAGEMGNSLQDNLVEKSFKLEALTHGYTNVVKYIHEMMISVKQLLPVFNYLSNHNTGENYDYQMCQAGLFTCNDFIEDLNIKQPSSYQGTKSSTILSDKINRTYKGFSLDKKGNSKWMDGEPFNYPKDDGIIYGEGDETVTSNSAQWGTVNVINIVSKHSDLPYYSQSEISKILINKEIINFGTAPTIKKILFIGIKSPADLVVTDPNGKSFGFGFGDNGNAFYTGPNDPEFITIPDPIPGEYKISVMGNGEGHFEVETSLLGDDLENTKTYSGTIKNQDQYLFSVNLTDESLQELKVQESPAVEIPKQEAVFPPTVEKVTSNQVTKEQIKPIENLIQNQESSTISPSTTLAETAGQVKGITTTQNPSHLTKRTKGALYIVIGFSILILGYLVFYLLKIRKKNK